MVIEIEDKSFFIFIHFVSYFNYKNLLYINIINQIKITKNVKFVIINKFLKSKIISDGFLFTIIKFNDLGLILFEVSELKNMSEFELKYIITMYFIKLLYFLYSILIKSKIFCHSGKLCVTKKIFF